MIPSIVKFYEWVYDPEGERPFTALMVTLGSFIVAILLFIGLLTLLFVILPIQFTIALFVFAIIRYYVGVFQRYKNRVPLTPEERQKIRDRRYARGYDY